MPLPGSVPIDGDRFSDRPRPAGPGSRRTETDIAHLPNPESVCVTSIWPCASTANRDPGSA